MTSYFYTAKTLEIKVAKKLLSPVFLADIAFNCALFMESFCSRSRWMEISVLGCVHFIRGQRGHVKARDGGITLCVPFVCCKMFTMINCSLIVLAGCLHSRCLLPRSPFLSLSFLLLLLAFPSVIFIFIVILFVLSLPSLSRASITSEYILCMYVCTYVIKATIIAVIMTKIIKVMMVTVIAIAVKAKATTTAHRSSDFSGSTGGSEC